VRLTRSMHVKTYLLHSIRDIWSREGDILQGTNQASIVRGVGHRVAICC